MELYETLGVLGEGTYGVVVKARHKETQQLVAIKKFKESEDDEHVRKTSLREIRMLKNLRHFHIVNLLEVFRRKQKLYLVFEFIDRTILELIEKKPHGLDEQDVRRYTYQLLKAVEYCHKNNVIHRDIKPENILIAKNGTLKLCDFGFARAMGGAGAKYTEYVATRWYRSPELLVGDTEYGRPVDIWAIGCIFSEISTGKPLFPGESDIDQLAHIIRCFGRLIARHEHIFRRNREYAGVELPNTRGVEPLDARFNGTAFSQKWLQFLKSCLRNEPDARETCAGLLQLPYFSDRGWDKSMDDELGRMEAKERSQNQWWHSQRNGGGNGTSGMMAENGTTLQVPPPTTSSTVPESETLLGLVPKKAQSPPTQSLPQPTPLQPPGPLSGPPLSLPEGVAPGGYMSSNVHVSSNPLPLMSKSSSHNVGPVPIAPTTASTSQAPPSSQQPRMQTLSMFGPTGGLGNLLGGTIGGMSSYSSNHHPPQRGGPFADFNVVKGLGTGTSLRKNSGGGSSTTPVFPTLSTLSTGGGADRAVPSELKLMYKKAPVNKHPQVSGGVGIGVVGASSVPHTYGVGTYGGSTTVLHPGGSLGMRGPSTSHAQTRGHAGGGGMDVPMHSSHPTGGQAPVVGTQRRTSKSWDSK